VRRYPHEKVRLDLSQAQRWRSLTLVQRIEHGVADPGQPAVVFEGRARGWGELREQSRRVGHALLALGVEPADRVALLSRNRLEYLELETGIAAACAIMVALNWRLREAEIEAILRRAEPVVLITEAAFAPMLRAMLRDGRLPGACALVLIDGEPQAGEALLPALLAQAATAPVPREPHFDDPHEIIFTSGTTGTPKGVVWTLGGHYFNALQQVVDFRMGPHSSTYAMIDLFYIGGRHDFTWAALYAGGTVHVKASGGFDARAALAYVCEHRVSHVLWVPTMIYEILRVPDLASFDTTALRAIMCGGQVLAPEIVRRMRDAFPHSDFVQVYGLTEGGGSVTFMPSSESLHRPQSCGRASLNARIRIVDEAHREVPAGTEGEICVQAPSVSVGYWDDPALTAEQIVDGWLHTGDAGHVDELGYLVVTGRIKDLIKSGGMTIAPAEIEALLRSHPGVADAAVIGVPHPKWGEQVCAVVERRPGAQPVAEELIALCARELAGFKKPSIVEIVDALPRTASGKPQKFVLRARHGSAFEAPAGAPG
jgi:fatty-acyl-CoA synthase